MEQKGEKMTGITDDTMRSGCVAQAVMGHEKGDQTLRITGRSIGNLLGSETFQVKW